MGFFGSGNKTTQVTTNQYDERVAAADQAIVAQKGGAVGSTATALENSSGNKIQLGGLQVGEGATADFSQRIDPQVIEQFANSLRYVIESEGNNAAQQQQTLADLVTSQTTNTNKFVEDALGKVAARANAQETGGDTERNKIILVIVLAVLALIGLFVWRH